MLPTVSHAVPTGAGQSAKPREWLRSFWARFTVDQKFLVIGGLVSLIGMLAVGLWTTARIEASVVRNTALSAAIYMESFIAPLSQELAIRPELSDDARDRLRRQLDKLVIDKAHPGQIVSVKIWVGNGLVAFATDDALIGQHFEPSENLRRAWRGELVAEFDDLDNEESAVEQARGIPLLEVYNPVHSVGTGEIIAVAEFYQVASQLEEDLRMARLQALGLVAAVWTLTFLACWGVVRTAGRTIERQKRQLERRIEEVIRISDQNRALRDRVAEASRSMTALNERLLRRIGAELHDGPAQAISLAILRLDRAMSSHDQAAAEAEVATVKQVLDEAITTIRTMSRGLILPELENASLSEVVRLAVESHEMRTGDEVDLRHDDDADSENCELPLAYAIAIYRFVQEGLMNAHRHTSGAHARVEVRAAGSEVFVAVSDDGPGFNAEASAGTARLGLAGLRERAESLGGILEVQSGNGGTTLVFRLKLVDDVEPEGTHRS